MVARYVDDYFGADKAGVRITGKDMLHLTSAFVGVPCDVEKGVDRAREMVVLGMMLAFHPETRVLTITVDAMKAFR